MLIGDRRKFLSCFLTLKTEIDQDTLEPQPDLAPAALEFCESVGSKARTVQDILNGDSAVLAAIQVSQCLGHGLIHIYSTHLCSDSRLVWIEPT